MGEEGRERTSWKAGHLDFYQHEPDSQRNCSLNHKPAKVNEVIFMRDSDAEMSSLPGVWGGCMMFTTFSQPLE